jgi:hypothetical protein
MLARSPGFRCVLALLVVTPWAVLSTANAEHIFGRIKRLDFETKYHGTEPCSGKDGAVECLAENIDWLEHFLDTYGTVVAKQPDIWGEARLTKHRDEYERIMFRELTNFSVKINASISQSDSSFLAQALALSAAASGQAPTITPATAEQGTVSVQSNQTTAILQGAASITETEPFGKFGIDGENKISLEPVIELDQLSRYLQHLHELRRINEGDDTSDSPGYSMNLVRIPVSILPGKLTRTGFGAEVTITAAPVLSDDLLPTTFRNLVVNDVVDMLGLPLVRVTEGLSFGKFEATVAGRLLSAKMREIERALRTPPLATRLDPSHDCDPAPHHRPRHSAGKTRINDSGPCTAGCKPRFGANGPL